MAYAYAQYTGNGSTTSFSVPFPYLLRAHVKLYYGLNLVTGGNDAVLVDGTNYSWTNATTVALTVAPPNGTVLTIRRETPTSSRLVDWSDGSNLTADSLDTADLQNFYTVQELQDYIDSATLTPTANIADNSITASKLSGNAVVTAKIADSAITTAKLAEGSVTTEKVNNAGISGAKITDGTIATAKIADGQITTAKIADAQVTTDKIADAAITAAKIAANAAVPIGAVFHFAASYAPPGYLKCNGDVVPNGNGTVQGITANFSALFAIIGSTYGSLGKLPDLRGEFVRCWDDSRGVDSGRGIGSWQDQGYQSHAHGVIDPGHGHGVSDPGHAHGVSDPGHAHLWGTDDSTGASGTNNPDANGGTQWRGWTSTNGTGISINGSGTGIWINGNTTGISISASGGSQTRPRNVALLACIKY